MQALFHYKFQAPFLLSQQKEQLLYSVELAKSQLNSIHRRCYICAQIAGMFFEEEVGVSKVMVST